MSTTQVSLRIEEDLKHYFSEIAEYKKRSVHRELVDALEFYKNKRRYISASVSELFDSIDVSDVLRIRSSSTYKDCDRILNIIKNLETERLVFGCRVVSEPNGLAMVFLAETKNKALLFDSTLINAARRPRQLEVIDIFKTIYRQGDWQKLEFIKDAVPETSELSSDEALDVFLQQDMHTDFFDYISRLSRGYCDESLLSWLSDPEEK